MGALPGEDIAQAVPAEVVCFSLFIFRLLETQAMANSCDFASINILQPGHIYLGNQGPLGGVVFLLISCFQGGLCH